MKNLDQHNSLLYLKPYILHSFDICLQFNICLLNISELVQTLKILQNLLQDGHAELQHEGLCWTQQYWPFWKIFLTYSLCTNSKAKYVLFLAKTHGKPRRIYNMVNQTKRGIYKNLRVMRFFKELLFGCIAANFNSSCLK